MLYIENNFILVTTLPNQKIQYSIYFKLWSNRKCYETDEKAPFIYKFYY